MKMLKATLLCACAMVGSQAGAASFELAGIQTTYSSTNGIANDPEAYNATEAFSLTPDSASSGVLYANQRYYAYNDFGGLGYDFSFNNLGVSFTQQNSGGGHGTYFSYEDSLYISFKRSSVDNYSYGNFSSLVDSLDLTQFNAYYNGYTSQSDPAGDPTVPTQTYTVFTTFTPGAILTPTAAVPEPASWAMMIGGVGIAGGALRRKRSVKVTYA